jgi:hypothetical protein
MHRIKWIHRGESAVPISSTPAVLVREDAPTHRRLIEGHLKQWALILCATGMERRHEGCLEVQINHDRHCLTAFCPRSMELSFVQGVAAGNGSDRVNCTRWQYLPGTESCLTLRHRSSVGFLHLRIKAVRDRLPVSRGRIGGAPEYANYPAGA